MIQHGRLETAKRLQKVGWAICRYAQRIERCCAQPSPEHEASAREQLTKLQQQFDSFRFAKLEWKRAVKKL